MNTAQAKGPKKNTRVHPVIGKLDARIEEVLKEVRDSEIFHVLVSPETQPELARRIMREIYQEIVWYQPTVIEKTISIIGQMPRSIPAKWIRAMLVHQSEEFDHGEMALRDLCDLGQDEEVARALPMSPASHATAAFWCMLEHQRRPAAYLGALYLFEGLTPLVTELVKKPLVDKGFRASSLEFVEFHSTEDIVHQNMIKSLICKVAEALPGSEEEMLHGLDCFLHVYPLPVWNGAYQRAIKSTTPPQK